MKSKPLMSSLKNRRQNNALPLLQRLWRDIIQDGNLGMHVLPWSRNDGDF